MIESPKLPFKIDVFPSNLPLTWPKNGGGVKAKWTSRHFPNYLKTLLATQQTFFVLLSDRHTWYILVYSTKFAFGMRSFQIGIDNWSQPICQSGPENRGENNDVSVPSQLTSLCTQSKELNWTQGCLQLKWLLRFSKCLSSSNSVSAQKSLMGANVAGGWNIEINEPIMNAVKQTKLFFVFLRPLAVRNETRWPMKLDPFLSGTQSIVICPCFFTPSTVLLRVFGPRQKKQTLPKIAANVRPEPTWIHSFRDYASCSFFPVWPQSPNDFGRQNWIIYEYSTWYGHINFFYASHFNGPKHLFRFVPPCSFFAILCKKSHRMMNNNALEFWQVFLETILVVFQDSPALKIAGPHHPRWTKAELASEELALKLPEFRVIWIRRATPVCPMANWGFIPEKTDDFV